jgi:prevent-host-death family protein
MGVQMSIPAAVFKAECLKLMDEVARTGRPVVITKHGRPVAQLAPVPRERKSLFGYMKHTFKVTGDVVAPVDEVWSAPAADEDHLLGGARRIKATQRGRTAGRSTSARKKKK